MFKHKLHASKCSQAKQNLFIESYNVFDIIDIRINGVTVLQQKIVMGNTYIDLMVDRSYCKINCMARCGLSITCYWGTRNDKPRSKHQLKMFACIFNYWVSFTIAIYKME